MVLVCQTFGMGVLMLPSTIGQMGFFFGTLTILIGGLSSTETMLIYFQTLKALKRERTEDELLQLKIDKDGGREREMVYQRDGFWWLDDETLEFSHVGAVVTENNKKFENFIFWLWNINLFFYQPCLWSLFAEQMDKLHPLGSDSYVGSILWRLIAFTPVCLVCLKAPNMRAIDWTGHVGTGPKKGQIIFSEKYFCLQIS